MEYYTLNNGMQIPVIGIGTNTFGKKDHRFHEELTGDTTELLSAIEAGYRLIDTAIMYRNESVIGAAVKQSGIDRKEFWITSKIPSKPEWIGTDEAVHNAVRHSLKELDMDYIDLYLVHHPWDDKEDMLRVWRILESYADNGTIKMIGVSNFNEEQLGYLLDHARILPAVNQIESHPGKWQHELIGFCLDHGVRPQAWGPLSRLDDNTREAIQKIGDRYGKTWAQVCLRYQLDLGMIVIPKSHDAARQKANLDVFDFHLDDKDRKLLAAL